MGGWGRKEGSQAARVARRRLQMEATSKRERAKEAQRAVGSIAWKPVVVSSNLSVHPDERGIHQTQQLMNAHFKDRQT